MHALRRIYARLKASYLDTLGYRVPEAYRSSFVHWGGSAEIQYVYRRMTEDLPAGGRVLVVGVQGGRDYFLFSNLGFEVRALDIAPQPDVEGLVLANVEEDLPFPDEHFDAVVISEVLEHLREDVRALDNLARVLRPEGRLIASLPYYNDRSDGHMRIFSPVSARRLFAMGGFRVDECVERPALLNPAPMSPLVHALSLVTWLFTRRTAYGFTNRVIGSFTWRVGRKTWLRPLRRASKTFGAFFCCSKQRALDAADLNREIYTEVGSRKRLDQGREE